METWRTVAGGYWATGTENCDARVVGKCVMRSPPSTPYSLVVSGDARLVKPSMYQEITVDAVVKRSFPCIHMVPHPAGYPPHDVLDIPFGFYALSWQKKQCIFN